MNGQDNGNIVVDEVFLLVALILSIVFLAAAIGGAIAYAAVRKKNAISGAPVRKKLLSPFQVAVVGFIVAAFTAFLPMLFSSVSAADGAGSSAIQAIAISIQKVFRIFSLDEDFSDVLRITAQQTAWVSAYRLYLSLLFVSAAGMTVSGVVLVFFKEFASSVRFHLKKGLCRQEAYVFSELNEKSLQLAKDVVDLERIRKEAEEWSIRDGVDEYIRRRFVPKKKVVVFCDVFEKNEETEYELIAEAKSIGAICTKRDVTQIWLPSGRTKVFLIGEDQKENLEQALVLFNRKKKDVFRKRRRLIPRKMRAELPRVGNRERKWIEVVDNWRELYVFNSSKMGEAVIESVVNDTKIADSGWSLIRRVDENANLCRITFLSEKSSLAGFFRDKKKSSDGKKRVSTVIVGLGSYGAELAKTICWLGMLPDYEIKVTVFEKDEQRIEAFRRSAPALFKPSYGPAQILPYILDLVPCDVKSPEFEDELNKIGPVTDVFVTLGDDADNVAIALEMRKHFRKIQSTANIYAVVFNRMKQFPEDIKITYKNKGSVVSESYGVTLIGSMKEVYSVENIEQRSLEIKAKRSHINWTMYDAFKAGDDKYFTDAFRDEAGEWFNKNEYSRVSSIARVMHENEMKKLGYTGYGMDDMDKRAKYEHDRWTVYMYAQGYEFGGPGRKDHIAKTHYDLIPRDKLDEEEKKKDSDADMLETIHIRNRQEAEKTCRELTPDLDA
ncbi:MAG: hypothetical protein IJ735_04135 [Clostridia bacterium]|nr:hypothetical protein [Clostridia bacterium]